MTPAAYLAKIANESLEVRQAFVAECSSTLVEAARMLGECIRAGGKILICGNGGSAADAQHLAAELVGRMIEERPPLPAIALTTDTSNLTAIGNDYGYDLVFVKQVQALARSGDVLIAFSTSGNSRNVLAAVEVARSMGCKVIGLTGGSGGKLRGLADLSLCASRGQNSCRIQEQHLFALHAIVDLLDSFFLTPDRAPKTALAHLPSAAGGRGA